MTLEDYRSAWQEHNEDELSQAGEEEIADWVAERAERFEKKIRRRDLLETGAAVFVAAFFGYEIVTASRLLARMGAGVLLVAAGYVVWRLRRARRAFEADGTGLPVAVRLRLQLRKVEAQIELLESVLWWYVAPLALGAVLFIVGTGGGVAATLLSVAVVVAGSGLVWRLNRRAARKGLRPRRRELIRRIRRLEEG